MPCVLLLRGCWALELRSLHSHSEPCTDKSSEPAGCITSWKHTLIVLSGDGPRGWLRTRGWGPSLPIAARPCSGATCGRGLGTSQHLPVFHGDVITVRGGTFQKKRAWCLFNTWLLSSTEAWEMTPWGCRTAWEPCVCLSLTHPSSPPSRSSLLENRSSLSTTKCLSGCCAWPEGPFWVQLSAEGSQ